MIFGYVWYYISHFIKTIKQKQNKKSKKQNNRHLYMFTVTKISDLFICSVVFISLSFFFIFKLLLCNVSWLHVVNCMSVLRSDLLSICHNCKMFTEQNRTHLNWVHILQYMYIETTHHSNHMLAKINTRRRV